jgi:uncharacterized CHY-type Zn-finger protein
MPMKRFANISREEAAQRGLVICNNCSNRFTAAEVRNRKKCPTCKSGGLVRP